MVALGTTAMKPSCLQIIPVGKIEVACFKLRNACQQGTQKQHVLLWLRKAANNRIDDKEGTHFSAENLNVFTFAAGRKCAGKET